MLSPEPGSSCTYLWELEDSLPWELLSGVCSVPFGSIKLSVTTASEAACRVDQSFSCTSLCLDYRKWEAWWEETVSDGDMLQYFLVAADHLSPPPSPWVEACGWSRTSVCLKGMRKGSGQSHLPPWKRWLPSAAALLSAQRVPGAERDVGPRPRGCPLSWMMVAPSALPCSKEVNCLGVHGGIRTKSCWAELLYNWDRSQGLLSLC